MLSSSWCSSLVSFVVFMLMVMIIIVILFMMMMAASIIIVIIIIIILFLAVLGMMEMESVKNAALEFKDCNSEKLKEWSDKKE